MEELTPFQTVGPFFEVAIPAPGLSRLVGPATPGEKIRVDGSVVDGGGQPVPDALIETWQADTAGRYWSGDETGGSDGQFVGFSRVPTDPAGRFAIETVKPGSVPGPDGEPQAPHLAVSVLARGILTRLVTRIYFEDEPRNATDRILSLVPEDRRETLIARRTTTGAYRFEIVLQGPGETVFFDV